MAICGSFMMVIEFKNVSKIYPHYHSITGGLKHLIFTLPKALKDLRSRSYVALSDVSFSVKKGECVGIIGRNGAGKSTTLGLIAQVIIPNSGSVTINGRVSPLLELGGGFHPELTGLENIQLNGVLMGLPRKKIKEKLDQIIAFSELENFIDQPIRTYSSGMISRLGFSIVAHLEPEILLIDEVLAVGDLKFQKKCIEKIQEFKQKGITMILVSHSSDNVLKVCERVIWIENNKIKMDGNSDEVVKLYNDKYS